MTEVTRVYVGTFADESGAPGRIAAYDRDPSTGALTELGATEGGSPGFLAMRPNGASLYAVYERGDGAVAAYRVVDDGPPTLLGEPVSTGGSGPCHLSVDPTGSWLVAANYSSGSVACLPIQPDGTLRSRTDLVQHEGHGPDPERQEGPHAHNARFASDGLLLAVDLGIDAVITYRIDAGSLVEVSRCHTTAGAGPRHLAFTSGGDVVVADELSSTVTRYRYAAGELSLVASIDASVGAAADGVRNYPSEIAVAGEFAYVANRGIDCVTVIGLEGGGLHAVTDVPCGGHWPRHLAVLDGGLYVANQHSGNVATFAIDASNGVPIQTGEVSIAVPGCVLPA